MHFTGIAQEGFKSLIEGQQGDLLKYKSGSWRLGDVQVVVEMIKAPYGRGREWKLET